ncbi:acetolactate synthase catalytic subunit [Variovorax sp. LjRoot290]|uniref:acetolactate synthase catalytic subunit n=1 Tax=Variovorax sp. LjRoot290 TaxID=3342316 RepID=UPI003ECF5639
MSTPATSGGTVADRVAAACRRHGVQVVFGQCNPVRFHLAVPQHGMRNIGYRTENAGGAMADGYARISRQTAMVTAQNGPAATLLVAPLAEALKSSVPIVALVQDVPVGSRERNAFQEYDHLKLFAGCSKWVGRIDSAERVDEWVDMAFRIATSGRCGPAVLLLPVNIADSQATGATTRRAVNGRFPLDPVVAAPERVREAARLLMQAERPLVIAGGGVHLSGAAPALADLQQRFALPVATTMMGKGAVSELHPLSLGVIGNVLDVGAPAYEARALVTKADVVLLLGTRTAANGTDTWSQYPRNARFIHIDIDPVEIDRNYESLRLVGDARLTLEALADAMSQLDAQPRQSARGAVEDAIATSHAAAQRLQHGVRTEDRLPIRPERLMHELGQLLPADAIVTADASYASVWISLYLTARRAGERFLLPRGLAGLGWGLPLAMGAHLARPEATVVSVVGDGGFGHVWGELEAIRRHGIKLVLIVLNNGVLSMQEDMEVFRYGGRTDTRFEPVDHAAIARACGLHGVRVSEPGALRAALQEAMSADRATLLDVIVDPAACPPLTAYSSRPSQLG